MRIVKRFVLAGVLTCAAIMPSPALAAWSKATTHNFVVYGEGSQSALRSAAIDLERFDALLRKQFRVPADDAPHPLPIYLLDRANQVGALVGSSDTAGFYSPSVGDTFAVSHRERTSSKFLLDARQVLYHEYAHHFMMRYFPTAYPAWYIEGFAEFLSTVKFLPDGRPDVGRPAHHRTYGLMVAPPLAIRDVLFRRPASFRGDLVEAFYGRSWLLVHMLANTPERSGQLAAYLKDIAAGAPQEKAAEKAFGDLDQLGRDLNAYRSKGMRYIRMFEPIGGNIAVEVVKLDANDDALTMPMLRRLSLIDAEDWGPKSKDSAEDKDEEGKDGEGKDGKDAEDEEKKRAREKSRAAYDAVIAAVANELTRLTAKRPDNPNAWVELALVQRAQKRPDVALVTVERALALNPNHSRARLLKGELMLVAAAEASNPTAKQWRDARAEIVQANRASPNDPLPLLSYRRSFELQGVDAPDSALAGLARAFELAPESRELRGRYAYQLATQKNFAGAINIARTLASDPHDRGYGARVLKEVRARARAAGYTGPGMGDAKDDDDTEAKPDTDAAAPSPAPKTGV